MFATAVGAVKTFASHARRRDLPVPDDLTQGSARLGSVSCPICDETMQVSDVATLEANGTSDFALHALRCDGCGMIVDRLYHASTGYEAGVPV